MWYSYNISLIKQNKMKTFTKDFEKVMIKLLQGKESYFDEFTVFKRTKLKTYLIQLKEELEKATEAEKKDYLVIFKANYKIDQIIKNNSVIFTFDDLENKCGKKIANITEELCEYLYEDFKDIQSFARTYISPKKYYEKFIKNEVIKGNCPFCGEYEMPSEHSKARGDFDHYLRKSKYPFVSMHYKNLVPMCSTCNEPPYKGVKEVLGLKKTYYPYSTQKWNNILEIEKIKHGKDIKLEKFKIVVENDNQSKKLENETWDEIFDIENRIKDKVRIKQKEIIGEIYREIEYRKIDNIKELEGEIQEKIKRAMDYRYNCINLYRESLFKYYLKDLKLFKKELEKNYIER
ncbi:MAG: hypothetical protein ACRC7N_02580 [Clostridium sp.]